MELNGGQALIKALEKEGVEVMFGLPGGAILPVYDPIIDSPIRHILVRHEQGAGHMAEGYAHATGRPGVAMVTSGPGATNIVTPLCRRLHGLGPDGRASPARCRGRHRHRRLPGMRHHRHHPVGHQAQLPGHRRPRTSPGSIREAFHIATTGRPGPGADRHPEGHRRSEEPALGHGLVLAVGRRRRGRPARLPADHDRPSRADPGGRRADPGGRAAGDLRRRRHPQGPGRRGAARAGRAVRHPRRHHADGPWRVPRRPPAVPRHAGHARQLHGGHVDAGERPARSRSAAASTTGSPARSPSSRPTPRSSTSTSTRPSWARCAGPTSPIVGDCRLVIEELVKAVRHLLDGGAEIADRRRGTRRSRAGRSATRSPTRTRPRATRSSRRWCSSTCATRCPRTPSCARASASTRCGPASTGSSATPTRG